MSLKSTARAAARMLRRVFVWPLEAALVFTLFCIARLLPLPVASFAMGGLVRLLGPVSPWQARARRNIERALPEMSPAERARTLRAMWWNLGRVLGEFPHVQRIMAKGRIEFRGLEHLRGLEGGGILIGAHIGNWEIGPFAAINQGHRVAAIYRPLNNPLLAGLLARREKSFGYLMFPKGREAAIGMIDALKMGRVMCLLVDQQFREGVCAEFFGMPAQTSASHVKLAIRRKAPLMFMRTRRLKGCRFRVEISPPLNLPKSDDDKSVAGVVRAINAELETWIRQTPEQWMWPHRRWGKNI